MIIVIIITAAIIVIPFLAILIMFYNGSKERNMDRNSTVMTEYSENSILNKVLNNSDPYLMDMMYNPKSKSEETFVGIPNNISNSPFISPNMNNIIGIPSTNNSSFISPNTNNNVDITDKKPSSF